MPPTTNEPPTAGDHAADDAAETGTSEPMASSRISHLRQRIDEIDAQIIALWQERAAVSKEVGAARIASGGTRLVLSREREIMERYRQGIGPDGTQVALLVLRAGRGPLGGPDGR